MGRAVLCAREFARQAGLASVAIVVDTDSAAIAEEARRWGGAVPFLRPPELAGDDVSSVTSSLAALERLERDGLDVADVILLQPTSPLRTGADVLACWREYDRARVPSVVSVVGAEHAPDIALRRDAAGLVHWFAGDAPPARRQDVAEGYWPSGAVYIISHDLLRAERRFIVPGVTAERAASESTVGGRGHCRRPRRGGGAAGVATGRRVRPGREGRRSGPALLRHRGSGRQPQRGRRAGAPAGGRRGGSGRRRGQVPDLRSRAIGVTAGAEGGLPGGGHRATRRVSSRCCGGWCCHRRRWRNWRRMRRSAASSSSRRRSTSRARTCSRRSACRPTRCRRGRSPIIRWSRTWRRRDCRCCSPPE